MRASSTRETSARCWHTWLPSASSLSTGTTRSPPAPASPARRRHDRWPAVSARLATDPAAREGRAMSHYAQLVVELTILALAIFLGVEVISKVPTLLHTPLMSGTNAIHGIVIVGALLVAGIAAPDLLTGWVGFIAMILAAANVVGGFVVTDRMLEMFKKREPPKRGDGET